MAGRRGLTLPNPTLLDRAIGYVSPQAEAKRLMARASIARYEAMSGGWDGGKRGRRQTKRWKTDDASPDSVILPDLVNLRSRSRDLVRNAPLATGAIDTIVTNVAGQGLRLKPEIDRDLLGLTEDEADAWEAQAKRLYHHHCQHCDYSDRLNMAAMEEVALRGVLEAGDMLVSMVHPPGPVRGLFSLRLQLIEAELVSNENFTTDTDQVAGGLHVDPGTGRQLGFWVASHYPNDRKVKRASRTWRYLPAYNDATGERVVLHLMETGRSGQSRGVPLLAPVIETIKQIADGTDAELMAMVMNACFAVVSKLEDGEALPTAGEEQSVDGLGRWDLTFEPGTVVEGLGPGEDISSFSSNRPNALIEPFINMLTKFVAVATGLSHEVLLRHFSASYSASRGALLQVLKFFLKRRSWLANSLRQPHYAAVIGEGVERGYISAPGFEDPLIRDAWLRASWIGPAQGSLNPKQENEADALAEDRGWKTADENTAEKTGGDWDAKHAQRAKEERKRRADGLIGTPAGAPSPAGRSGGGDQTDPDND